MRKYAEEVKVEWDKLSTRSGDWQKRIDEALKKLLELQDSMDELNLKLRQAEAIKDTWQPVGDLLIDSLQDHIEKVKVNSNKIACCVNDGWKEYAEFITHLYLNLT